MPLVQIFAKPPVQGRVKTRLIPDIGALKATEVYRYCLDYTLDLVRRTSLEYQVWLSAQSHDPVFNGETCQLQQGDNLGDRLYHALSQTLAQRPNEATILIGSDCLDLNAGHFTQAIEALGNHDLVLLPCIDGGFAMIGCQTVHPALFDNIQWSTQQVLHQALKNAATLGYRVNCLETVRDIDSFSDLYHYPALRALIH